MPAGKVAPFPKAGNAAPVSIGLKVAAPVAGGSKAKAVVPGAVAKPGAFGGRPRLFDATRFANATRDLALVPKARGRGTIPAIIFFATVGSLFLGAGIALVVVGEDNYIVDLMVFGGICLFMGVVIAVVGAFFVVRPILKERRRQALKMAMERAEQNPGPNAGDVGMAGGGRKIGVPQAAAYMDFQYLNHAMRTNDLHPSNPSSLGPQQEKLYNGRGEGSARASFSRDRGQVTVTPPPLLIEPLRDRPGTTSTELTTGDYRDMEEDSMSVDGELAANGASDRVDGSVTDGDLQKENAAPMPQQVNVPQKKALEKLELDERFGIERATPDGERRVPAVVEAASHAEDGDDMSVNDYAALLTDGASPKDSASQNGNASQNEMLGNLALHDNFGLERNKETRAPFEQENGGQNEHESLRQMLDDVALEKKFALERASSENDESRMEESVVSDLRKRMDSEKDSPEHDGSSGLSAADKGPLLERERTPEGDFVVALQIKGNLRT